MSKDEEFPAVYVDPVYATVSSRISTQSNDSADLKWIENCGLTGGVIKFLSKGTSFKKSSASYYVKIKEDTGTDRIAMYMDKAWKTRSPNIILSIISSPDHWKRWKNQKLKEHFQKGIIQAVNTTSLWLLTNGMNSGACKMIGDAIQSEKERRHLLAAHYSTKFITSGKVRQLPKITAIGIVPTSRLSYAEVFDTQEVEIGIEMENKESTSLLEELNPNLSNFIMLDSVQSQKDVDSIRLALEERFCRPVGKPKKSRQMNGEGAVEISTSTPMVGLLIQGSPSDIEHVCDLIRLKIPVLILKGTGSAADLFSFAYKELNHKSDEEHVNSYLKPELLKRIQKEFPNHFRNDELARNRCRDMIIECVQFSMKLEQNFLTMLDVETNSCCLKNLDKYILLALFESQEPKKGTLFQEQMQKDLKLTLDWNQCDLAVSQIFQKYDWMRIKISNSLMDLALLKKDRYKFVELFLQKNAIDLHRYFSHKKLLFLLNHYEDPEFFRTICLGEMLDYSPTTDYPVGKKFVYGERSGLNHLLHKTTYMKSLVSFSGIEHLAEMEGSTNSPAVAERKAMNILVYWAALNYDPNLTKTLWKKTEEPMAMALIVSMIWHSIAKRFCPDVDLKKKMLASSRKFGEMAVMLLEYSYQDSNLNTIALLDKRLEDFNNKTVIEIAHMAKNKYFIAHYICQKWLNRRWFGNLLIKKSDWGPIKIPNWFKIYLSLTLVFPMFVWITYDLADKKRREDLILEQGKTPTYEDEHEPVDDEPRSRHASVLVDDWIIKPSTMVVYKMKNAWLHGKAKFKVPIHLQFYYLWSAPITKFWLNQWFYVFFLILFSFATLYPYCGLFPLDVTVFAWIFTIWLELVRTTITKRQKYKELDLFWTVVEIFVIGLWLLVIMTARVPQYFKPFFSYLKTKLVMSIGLLYFYYRVLVVFLPISPILGPMIISFKRMIKHDFLTWFRMFLIIMVSGAITMHAVIYPNFPLAAEGIRVAFSRAFFAMFLTKIDDLEGAECSYIYENATAVSDCYNRRNLSFFYSIDPNSHNNEGQSELDKLRKCPYQSLGGYFVVIQYLLIVKLILITLLYALFSNTTSKVQEKSEAIYKYEKYSLIVDFEEKLILPPPFTIISYIMMIFQQAYYLVRYCYRKFRCSSCCRQKNDIEGSIKLSTLTSQSPEPYNYWSNFLKKLEQDEEQDQAEKERDVIQSQKLDTLINQFSEQKKFDVKLVEQISTLEHNMATCQLALEQLQHTMEKTNPKLQPSMTTDSTFIHVLSRQSPYPDTMIQRFPVFDKYVPWEVPYSAYDPMVYTCPIDKFPEKAQPFVDMDFLKALVDSKGISLQSDNTQRSGVMSKMPEWNMTTTIMSNKKIRKIDRNSYIIKDCKPIRYQLDTYNLPINPRGRTGLRGRGRLSRWGPNHNVMVVITRWKRLEEDFLIVEDKKVLEVITVQKTPNSEFTLPKGGDYGYMTMYSAVCQKFLTHIAEDSTTQIKPDMNEADMTKFFSQFSSYEESQLPVTSKVIYRGYLDDQSNTDNAWKEVEVWNLHFNKEGDKLKIKNKEKKWRTVSSYNTFRGSQDLILKQAAAIHNAYY